MAERHGNRVTAMLTADSAVQHRTRLLAVGNSHLHEFAHAALVETRKRIVLENLLVVVRTEELA